jgi:short-subunit dehydrogenase
MASTSKVVVITGASGGIGAALAKRLGGQGHKVVLAARRESELKAVASGCGADALPVVTDVTRRNEVERLRDRALQSFDHIDVWVNNAGRGISRKVMEISDVDIDEMVMMNIKSALYGIQAVLPHFQQRGEGHLINVSSMLGRVPLVSFRSAYSAAKAALNSLTASLRMDLRQTHPRIHVSVVMPGPVATEFARNALGTPPSALPSGGPPPGVLIQSAEDVAQVMAELIENPQPEVFTHPSLAETSKRYYQDVAAFEANSNIPR